ncbi:MAG TPA: hypothetical protein VNG32_01735, partial [Candidatus Dormibacteraeota bacterium]|nr:hypothetical protein [Candidatus Dormibacteraeota bacterium]
MANKVYDSDADKQDAPLEDKSLSDNQTSPGNVSHDRSGLDRNGLRDQENKSLYNPNDNQEGNTLSDDNSSATDGSNKSGGLGGLRDSEESGLDSGDNDSLYNDEGGDGSGLRGRARSRFSNLRARLLKNKLLVGLLAGSGLATVTLIIILIFFLGAYKVVDFAEHVAAYQFARTSAQMAENTTAIDSEKLGLDSLLTKYSGTRGVKLYNYLHAKYTASSGGASDLWSKLDQYRPYKIMQNFSDNNIFKLNTSTTNFGKTYISSVSGTAIGDTPAELQSRSLANAIKNTAIPGYKFVTRDIAISRSVAPGLIDALKAGGPNAVGPITRARVANAIRQKLNVSLTAWVIAKYLGKPGDTAAKDTATADAAEQQLSFNFGQGSSPIPPTGPESQYTKAAQDLVNVEAADAQDPTKSINPNQLSLDLANSLAKSFPAATLSSFQGIISELISFLNPVYGIATYVCLVYDGSLQKSQPSIDYQSQQVERNAILVQVEAAQEKDGSKVNAQAVGAADWKLGDIPTSNAEQRSSGQAIDTSSFASTEASPTGQYTYSLADFLPGPLATITQTAGGSACPVLTNLWFAGGVGLASLLTIPELGTTDGTLVGSAKAAVASFIPKSMSEFGAKVASAKGNIASFAFKTGRAVVGIGAATLLARDLVASEAGSVHSSLDTSQSYDNTVD